MAGEIVAVKDYLRDQVEALDGVLTYSFAAGEFEGVGQAREDVRAVVAAYERALDRTARVLVGMGKMDLRGRMLEVNQAKAALIVGAVERGLAACKLPPATLRAVRSALADEIGALSERREALQPLARM